jgi:stage III sporulation protein SpoIIIAA
MTQFRVTDDLDALLGILPHDIAKAILVANNSDDLLEVIFDLGRVPTARFVDKEIVLKQAEVIREDIDYVVEGVGEFNGDNRAGIARALHRIAAIRNRNGDIVGLTCRVGRAVYGTLNIIQDLVESGKSLLLLGRPGVGKTTMLREAARVLAETQRVVIVDTSNEIGGDGDVPHPAIGKARRMQVAMPSLQHEVMIEAVENHNPQVIVIDEIGRELEALAARTIAERGVQLIGTAHGHTLENLLLNPTLSDLVGGIDSVTLSDEEARRRHTQKTVLERRSPPTFDVLIEIQTRDRLAVHTDIAAAVDALLRGSPLPPEIRQRDDSGKIHIEKPAAAPPGHPTSPGGLKRQSENPFAMFQADQQVRSSLSDLVSTSQPYISNRASLQPVHIFAYGVARNRLEQAAKRLGVPAILAKDLTDAETIVTLRGHYRKHQQTIMEAERRGLPIYVLRSNTVNQMQHFLSDLFNLNISGDGENEEGTDALQETRMAIEAVLNGERWVELHPASSFIRRQQHEMARQANLLSHSHGKDPYRRVRIYRE